MSKTKMTDVELGKAISAAHLEPIGGPHDGESFNDDTPGLAAERLLALREAGYRVPQYAIDCLLEPGDEMEKKKHCSFCSKPEDDVDLLVSTPTGYRPKAYICERCVDTCRTIYWGRLDQRIHDLEVAIGDLIRKQEAPCQTEP